MNSSNSASNVAAGTYPLTRLRIILAGLATIAPVIAVGGTVDADMRPISSPVSSFVSAGIGAAAGTSAGAAGRGAGIGALAGAGSIAGAIKWLAAGT